MCSTCGCGGPEKGYRIYRPGSKEERNIVESSLHSHNHDHKGHNHSHEGDHHHNHDHVHDHDHPHDHSHDHQHNIISVEQEILGANNRMAERNRGYFEAKGILALNLVSSPGSGKTSLLEKTIFAIKDKVKCCVIEGDQQTDNDASRIAATGAEVIQINTGNACHLDAEMVHQALHELKPKEKSIVFIENVGNLVCPALFDLGEKNRIVIFSVTEGEDKPLKYPNMFNSSGICVINKTDLLPYLDFNIEQAKQNVLKVNPKSKIIELSVKSGEGMEVWIKWLKEMITN
jgi:hydrogenase nickel incorporation protein HypB